MDLYRDMALARAVELAMADLWEQGLIAGEMHLGTGEEGLAASVAAHLQPRDAVALDHRPTPLMVLMGVDLVSLIREMLGREDGLCRGRGGHMHLFSRDHRVASSGIVGAAGPLATGFALSGRRLRPGSVAVAFFGDGAMNQGMLLESFNLAAAWGLPVIFVCKDNKWAITTRTSTVTSGRISNRAKGFGLPQWSVNGTDVAEVDGVVTEAFQRARLGKGPSFLHVSCPRLDGHFLGDPMMRTAKHPISEGRNVFTKVLSAAFNPKGGGVTARAASIGKMMGLLRHARKDQRDQRDDPLVHTRSQLPASEAELDHIDTEVIRLVQSAVDTALSDEE